jgi:ATP-binding cassette subfamily B multidrug efflux pump
MKNKNGLCRVLGKTISHSKKTTLLAAVLIALSVGAALFPPLILERIINDLSKHQMLSLSLPIAYFGLLSLSGLLESGQNVMITVFGQKVTHGLRSELCAKLGRLPTAYFTQHEPGKITSCFINDVDVVDSLFSNGIISMIADAFKVMSILTVIFYKSTGLGILMLLVTPPLFMLTRLFQKRMLAAQLANRVAVSKVNNHVPETICNLRMIRTLFRQKYMEHKYDDYIEESYRATDQSNLYNSIYSPIVIFTNSCIIALMMIFAASSGGMQQFFGISVGTAVAITAYVDKLFKPLGNIGMEIQNIQSAVAGMKRINEFLQESERKISRREPDSNLLRQNAAPAICFDHVYFGYDDKMAIFRDLCFVVEPRQTTTLVGRTGAGKSTAFRLLLGLYTPQKGRVLVDGVDASQIPDTQKRNLFGYVEQTFRLVFGTVAEQISLFDASISQQQVETAAKLVGLLYLSTQN